MLQAMILRQKLSPLSVQPRSAATPLPPVMIPAWLRQAAQNPETLEDVVFAAGAALAMLDAVVRRQERWAGVWRQRLALAAAAATARQVGRVEDEAALRDAVSLTHPGDDVGPAGHILLAWRSLVSRPTETLLSKHSLAVAIGAFGLAGADGIASDLVDEVSRIAASGKTMFAAAFEAIELLQGYGRDIDRELGPWLADAVAAARLGWPKAVPLFAAGLAAGAGSVRSRSSERGEEASAVREASRQRLLAGYASAALQAIDLSADLGRRADRLLAIAPKLRAKGADAVVEKLLDDDALVASQPMAGMSDRGLRRLFERLNELGAVRELSGRSSFRLYGL